MSEQQRQTGMGKVVYGAVAVAVSVVVFGVGAIYDYNHNPTCVLPMHNCREGAVNCIPPCPGPDVHWLLVGIVALLLGGVVYAFLALSNRARERHQHAV